jgi:hypothetical protein
MYVGTWAKNAEGLMRRGGVIMGFYGILIRMSEYLSPWQFRNKWHSGSGIEQGTSLDGCANNLKVINRVFGTFEPVEVLDDTCCISCCGREVVGGAWAVDPVSAVVPCDSLESLWSSVWCILSHFLHLFVLGHCLAKWPDLGSWSWGISHCCRQWTSSCLEAWPRTGDRWFE